MNKGNKKDLWISIILLTAFILWTSLLRLVDVQAIGPKGSTVGFAAVNQYIHQLTGVHFSLYHLTDWLGLVPVAFAFGFAVLGVAQWVHRKHLSRVDYSLFILGGFYIVVAVAYLLFESVVINYRPVLIDGFLEVSYPSSTTLLVMCVMPTAIMQFSSRIQKKRWNLLIRLALSVFIFFMVVGRLISGVHWFTDIVGGALLSTGLVMMYRFLVGIKEKFVA